MFSTGCYAHLRLTATLKIGRQAPSFPFLDSEGLKDLTLSQVEVDCKSLLLPSNLELFQQGGTARGSCWVSLCLSVGCLLSR